MVGAAWAARASVKQAQVVVDLCYGAYRGPGLCEVDFCSMEIAGDKPSI